MRHGRLMNLRQWLSRKVTNPLQGVTFRRWQRLLADERIDVDPDFQTRATLTGALSLLNSLCARIESRRFGHQIDAVRVRRPLFILGHYRSGTTHLHNLLATDRRLAFPNYFQVSFPNSFLVSESLGAGLADRVAIRTRPHDNVTLNMATPAEDELALCSDTFLSPHMGWHFPSRETHYRRYLTFRDADAGERRAWIESLQRFARKLTLRYRRPLVFKSPCHTARIPLILEAFPDARFVHIHRDPFAIFQSTRHMEIKITPLFQYQHRDLTGIDESILSRYRKMYDSFFADRITLPPGRLVNVSYSGLTRDPIGTLREIYETLGLPEFDPVRPEIERYLTRINGYRNNVYPELGAAIRQRIAREWRRSFEEWGYGVRPLPRRA